MRHASRIMPKPVTVTRIALAEIVNPTGIRPETIQKPGIRDGCLHPPLPPFRGLRLVPPYLT